METASYHFYEIASIEDIPNGGRIFLEIGPHQIVVFNICLLYTSDAADE